MTTDDYKIAAGVPAVNDYRELRVAAGLSPRSERAAMLGLPNTLFGVVVTLEGVLVGMGRIVGDGGTSYQVVDIAVRPEHQGRGLGKRIMSALMEYLHTVPERAHVSLIADGPAKHLYAQFGFAETAPASVAMALKVRTEA
jgi:ribosomal protein S18 acetylase RimI-like enzyme